MLSLEDAKPEDFTLKNITVHPKLSEETHCYHAELFFKGTHIANVANRGHGGCDDFLRRTDLTFKEVNDTIGRIFPECTNPYIEAGTDGHKYPQTLEIFCGDLVNFHLNKKELRKLTRGKVAFVTPNNGECYTIKHNGNIEAAKRQALAKFPDAKILNDLDDKKAIAILFPEMEGR